MTEANTPPPPAPTSDTTSPPPPPVDSQDRPMVDASDTSPPPPAEAHDRPVDASSAPMPDTHERSVDGSPASPVGPPERPGAAIPADRRDDVEAVDARWRDIQLRFVDDPQQAAEDAEALATEVIDRLRQAIEGHKDQIDSWRSSDSDTDQLLRAVREYRSLIERVVAIDPKLPTVGG